MSVDLVYIVGIGHTGSTLLDLVLGSHPEIISLGEMFCFDDWVRENRLCTCGEPVPKCAFWSQVIKEIQRPGYSTQTVRGHLATDIRWEQTLRLERIRHLLSVGCFEWLPWQATRWSARHLAPEVGLRAENAFALFQAVRSVSKEPIVIDSSKSARRMRVLFAFRPETTRVLFLSRDGRGWLASHIKQTGVSPELAAQRWLEGNRQVLRMLRTLPSTAYRHVRYEEICRRPESAIEAICDFLGIAYEPTMLRFRRVQHHNINGNPMRVGGDERIVEDLKWRRILSERELAVFERVAGKLNKRLLGEFYLV